MLTARLIDFCFHVFPEKTFGEMLKFANELFKIRDGLSIGKEYNPVIGVVDGEQIILTPIYTKNSITYKLELGPLVWVIHDNSTGVPNQDFSREILQYMGLHFNDKTLYDIFNLEDRVHKPEFSDLYALWIKLIEEFNINNKGFEESNIWLGPEKCIRIIKPRPTTRPDEIIGKVDIIKNGVFDSFVFTTDGIPFKKAMELRTTLIKQKGGFNPKSALSSNPDFTQKEF